MTESTNSQQDAAGTPGAAFRCGTVAIVGRPNVGKSTLLNAMLGQKLAIVSPKPHTTRHKLLGVLNGEGFQAALLDLPAILGATREVVLARIATSHCQQIPGHKDRPHEMLPE